MKTPETISRRELAELLGVTPPRVSQLAADGLLEPNADGSYPAIDSLKAVCAMLRDKMGGEDLKQQQLLKKNRLLDVEIAKAEGDALDAAAVEKAWANIVLLARQRLLRIPNKLAPRLPFAKSEAEIEQVIQQEVDEALTELSRQPSYGGAT